MKFMIPENERAFAENALDAMHDTVYRPWRPEPAEHYSSLASVMEKAPEGVVELSEADASRVIFAVLSFRAYGPARDSLLARLREAFRLPERALSLQGLSKLDGKPVFIPAMGQWALVHMLAESRSHDPLPELKGILFTIDPIARGTLCVKANPYA